MHAILALIASASSECLNEPFAAFGTSIEYGRGKRRRPNIRHQNPSGYAGMDF